MARMTERSTAGDRPPRRRPPSASSSSCRRTADASYAAIAKAVGLSEAAARARVQKLLDSEVMQVVAVTDPIQVGFTRQAMIGVRTEGDPIDGRRPPRRAAGGRLRRHHGRQLRPAGRGRLRGRPAPARRHPSDPRARGRRLLGDLRLPQAQQAALQLGNPMSLHSAEGKPYDETFDYQAAGRDHLWLHFTRHSTYENGGEMPLIVKGEGAQDLGQPRPRVHRRPGRPVRRPGRPRSRGAGRGGRQAGRASWRSSRSGPSRTRAPSSWPTGSPRWRPATSTASSSPPAAARPSSPPGSWPSSTSSSPASPTSTRSSPAPWPTTAPRRVRCPSPASRR